MDMEALRQQELRLRSKQSGKQNGKASRQPLKPSKHQRRQMSHAEHALEERLVTIKLELKESKGTAAAYACAFGRLQEAVRTFLGRRH